ncbi:hypothetical protein N0V88_007253 [Collariella sp. IMI 366227]|nr:hypothetical protein N0V88_007253 [Collariella sp. IMI 366227]
MFRIKAEPGVTSQANGAATRAQSVVQLDSATPSERSLARRQARSHAPSIDTRFQPQSISGHDTLDDDGDVVLMEVRPTPLKPERERERALESITSQSFQSSYMGPNRSLIDIGQKLKDINDALGELQARGIQHVASLPELVLVGDQSSGKSSLMSAIAGLSLPRSSGVCTRCPIHIRVSRSEEWSCRVFLKGDYEFVKPPRPLTERDVTMSNKFPPWVKLDPSRQTRQEFKTVRDQFDSEQIETVLRCAQVAILNPEDDYRRFIPKLKGEATDSVREQILQQVKKAEEAPLTQFSPNTVALEVKGPDLADLNFYDLPGVFVNAKRAEDIFLEKVVQNLTREYIARPSAIILCAVPMNLDAENSLAMKLIRGARAESRCIGVMTKADLLPKDDNDAANWLSMLDGQIHRTGHGYFITSRQGSDLEEQNKMEEAFFHRTADATGEWPDVFDAFGERCGVEKLKAFLSLRLGEEFAKILPEVKCKVDCRLQAIDKQLMQYPDPPPNPELAIMRSLTEFIIHVKNRITDPIFQSMWDREICDPFKATILSLKPKFNVIRDQPRQEPTRAFIDLSGDNPTASPTINRKRGAPVLNPVQSTPKRVRSHVVKTETPDGPVFPSTPNHHRTATPVALTPSRGLRSKSLMDIRNLIRNTAIPGQPDVIFGGVYEPLSMEATRTWEPHLVAFINHTFTLLQREILTLLSAAFSQLKNRAAYHESLTHMRAFLETLKTSLHTQLQTLHHLETQRLFTKDVDALKRNKSSELRHLTRHRNHFRIAAAQSSPSDDNNDDSQASMPHLPKWETLTEEQRRSEETRMAKDLVKLGPDPFEQELKVAAYIRGYYLTAANRFVDYAAMCVMSGLLPRVASEVESFLLERLGLNTGATVEVLQRLMGEGPEIEQRRSDLRVEMETLDGAMKIIVDLETREREQQAGAASQFGNGFDASQQQAESVLMELGKGSGLNGDGMPQYPATAFGDA